MMDDRLPYSVYVCMSAGILPKCVFIMPSILYATSHGSPFILPGTALLQEEDRNLLGVP